MIEESELPEQAQKWLADSRKNNAHARGAAEPGYGGASEEAILEDSGADEERMKEEMCTKYPEWERIENEIARDLAADPRAAYSDHPKSRRLIEDKKYWEGQWEDESVGLGRRRKKIKEALSMKETLHREWMLSAGLLPCEDHLKLMKAAKMRDASASQEYDHEDEYEEDDFDHEAGYEDDTDYEEADDDTDYEGIDDDDRWDFDDEYGYND